MPLLWWNERPFLLASLLALRPRHTHGTRGPSPGGNVAHVLPRATPHLYSHAPWPLFLSQLLNASSRLFPKMPNSLLKTLYSSYTPFTKMRLDF